VFTAFDVIASVMLLTASISDVKKRTVSDVVFLAPALVAFILRAYSTGLHQAAVTSVTAVSIVVLLAFAVKNEAGVDLGGADIMCTGALAAVFGDYVQGVTVFLLGIAAAAIGTEILGKKEQPLIPYIAAAYILYKFTLG